MLTGKQRTSAVRSDLEPRRARAEKPPRAMLGLRLVAGYFLPDWHKNHMWSLETLCSRQPVSRIKGTAHTQRQW